MTKPLLVGMNNPISTRAGHELYPLPDGCTGNRLWKMLHARTGATMRQYVDTFERRNLVRGLEWDRRAARARAYEMVQELRGSGRTVVLLGQSVREAFDWVFRHSGPYYNIVTKHHDHGTDQITESLPYGLPPVLVHPQEAGGCTWRQIPHPSGRNLWYNEPKNVKVVELLMEELYVEYGRRSVPLADQPADL